MQGSIIFHCRLLNFGMSFFLEIQPKRFFSFLRVHIIKTIILYFYFLQFQVNFFIFLWQIWFFMIVCFSLYKRIEFSICLWRRFVFQDKFVLENLNHSNVDHSTAHCLFYSATIDKVIFHHVIKRRFCWTLLLAWMFQQLQHHPMFIQTANLLDGLRPNNNQNRRSWLNSSKDFPDQPAVDWLLNKYETQPTTKFPFYFHKIKSNNVLVHFSFLYSSPCFRW